MYQILSVWALLADSPDWRHPDAVAEAGAGERHVAPRTALSRSGVVNRKGVVPNNLLGCKEPLSLSALQNRNWSIVMRT